MERKTLFAIVLCLAVLLLYPRLVRVFYPEYGRVSAPTEQGFRSGVPEKPVSVAASSSREETPLPGNVGRKELSRVHEAKDETRKVVIGPYELVVSKSFGSIKTLNFTRFVGESEKEASPFLDAKDGSRGIGAVRLFLDGIEQDLYGFNTVIGTDRIESVLENEAFRFSKTFYFDNKLYGNELQISYRNKTDRAQEVGFEILTGSGLGTRTRIDPQYFEANWIRPGSVRHIKPLGQGKVKESEETFSAVSIKNRHFSSILKPLGNTAYFAGAKGFEDREFAAYLLSPRKRVEPGQTLKDEFLFYAGLNSVEDLKPFGLEPVVNFGKFDGICKLFLGLLQLIHGVVRNYGVAIIILTLGINVLMLPLTRASFLSMRRMQLVQPQVMKLREKFKSDPQKLNKETMELYKKHKANPMGGCLPMLLQMPIFISLYVALSKSTELLGARFLWARDLAYPDNVSLPFSLPVLGNTIHVLPLIMVVLMVVQQKLSQANMPVQDPNMAQQQKIMMTVMPIFFGFIFYPMPSGLVVYWLTNTVAMSAVQFMLKKATPIPSTT